MDEIPASPGHVAMWISSPWATERVAKQRVGVFVANERARASERELENAQVCTVTPAPHHTFVAGRHQLAAAADDAAVGPDEQLAVVQGAAGPLGEAQAHADAGLASRGAERLERRRRNLQRLGVKALEKWIDRHRVEGHGPERVARHEGFRKRDQLGPIASRLVDGVDGLGQGCGPVHEHRGHLRGRNTHALHSPALTIFEFDIGASSAQRYSRSAAGRSSVRLPQGAGWTATLGRRAG